MYPDDVCKVQLVSEIIPEQFEFVYDFEETIDKLNDQLLSFKSSADYIDYIISGASGLLCGLLDILWVGEFNLARGREYTSGEVDGFVKKVARLLGCKSDREDECVRFLEEKYPIPSDGNTPDFGGGLQHHLRDFAHHPTIAGLFFSLLTQFTGMSYGTDVNGKFKIEPVKDTSRSYIGENLKSKLYNGIVVWFFHLISDMAGSHETAGLSGGTGIPGPLLSLAKEISAVSCFRDISKDDISFSRLLSKAYNGTLFAEHDEKGRIIKDSCVRMDLRGELGAAAEINRQALPVVALECFVRGFYFFRHLYFEVKARNILSISDIASINWNKVTPVNSPTLTRMLTVANFVFTGVDLADAAFSEKNWLEINYVGVVRLAFSVGKEVKLCVERRNLVSIKKAFEAAQINTFSSRDNRLYGNIVDDNETYGFGLTNEQIVILYNIQFYKTNNDIENTSSETKKQSKRDWLEKWKVFVKKKCNKEFGIALQQFSWYSMGELAEKINEQKQEGVWYQLVLFEAMLFTPYFAFEENGTKPKLSFSKNLGNQFLQQNFCDPYLLKDFISNCKTQYKLSKKYMEFDAKKPIAILAFLGSAVALHHYINSRSSSLTLKSFNLFGDLVFTTDFIKAGSKIVAVAGGGIILLIGGSIYKDITKHQIVLSETAKMLTVVQTIFIKQEDGQRYIKRIAGACDEILREIKNDITNLDKDISNASTKDRDKLKEKRNNAKEADRLFKKVKRKIEDALKSCDKTALV